jgi:hypothetical protein
VASGIVGFVARIFVAHFRVIPVLNWHRKAVTSREKAGIQYVFNVRPVLCFGKLFLASLVLCVRALTNPKNQHQHNQQTNQTLQTTRTTTTTPPLKPSTHSSPFKTPAINDKTLPDPNPLSGAYSAPPQTPKSSILPSKPTPSPHRILLPHSSLQSIPLTLQATPFHPHQPGRDPFSTLANPFRSTSPRASATLQVISISTQVNSRSKPTPPLFTSSPAPSPGFTLQTKAPPFSLLQSNQPLFRNKSPHPPSLPVNSPQSPVSILDPKLSGLQPPV